MKKLILIILLFTFSNAIGQPDPERNILFNAFKQGNVNGGGNCASIALIKASIGTFGIGNVFTYSKNDADSVINVSLRNGQSFKLAYAEIRKATSENGFVLRIESEETRKIKSYADTCFAVMAKMNQIRWKYSSYLIALSKLLSGYNTPTVNELLGLNFRALSKGELRSNTNIVTYNSYHAVYSSYGYYDEARSVTGYELNDRLKERYGIKCAHYGCKPRNGFVIE